MIRLVRLHQSGATAGQVPVWDDTAGWGPGTPAALVPQQAGWFYASDVATGAGTFRLYNRSGAARTISEVHASVDTAPTGASLIVDVHKNGTTIFTTQANRPEIAAAANADAGTPDVTSWPDGEYLTCDVDQVGSTVAGADLVVTVVWS